MGRIDRNSWTSVEIYNANTTGQGYNEEFCQWICSNLQLVQHRCFNQEEFAIYQPTRILDNGRLFRKEVGIEINNRPSNVVNQKCIFCVALEQRNLDNQNASTIDEKAIIQFYNMVKRQKDNSTVAATKTLFAWWPDLFVLLDRTHNYNPMIFEFQTYDVDLPINRSNRIQDIDGIRYVKILRVIQHQLRQWINVSQTHQINLRRIDSSMDNSPFCRVIDKAYW